jgi:cupin 2 domain-containing protein
MSLRATPAVVDLLAAVPAAGASQEIFETLIAGRGWKLERIVSHGHATPAEHWYDQDQAEWVMVLAGAARLSFEGEPEPTCLRTGQAVLIPAHRRHRVEWTDPCEPTVWVALHFTD